MNSIDAEGLRLSISGVNPRMSEKSTDNTFAVWSPSRTSRMSLRPSEARNWCGTKRACAEVSATCASSDFSRSR